MRLTDAAADRIKAIMAKADKPIAGVRVGVKNGGCAGMAYTMEYAESAAKFDEVVEDKGVKLLIDPKAVLFLLGTEMDFKVDKLVLDLRVQQPEPDLGLRLRRVGAADAGRRSGGRRSALKSSARRGRRTAWTPRAIRELFDEFGPCRVRRMFGGAGHFRRRPDDRAGVARCDLSQGRQPKRFRPSSAKGSAPFSYATRNGDATLTSYWRMPDRLYDDPEELARWAHAAHCGRVARGRKPKEKPEDSGGKSRPLRQPSRRRSNEATSGSVSHMTRLRPPRLAA